MADQTVVHMGENSPEHVAYTLFEHVARVEGMVLVKGGVADRKWILDTYSECLIAVKNPGARHPMRPRS